MNSFFQNYLQLLDQVKNDPKTFGWMALCSATHAHCRMLSHATLTSNFLPAGCARCQWPIFRNTATATENKITHQTTEVITCPISERASSRFNADAYERDDRLLFFSPRDPRNLVFHLKFKLTSAPLSRGVTSVRSCLGGKKTQQHPQVPTPRE